MKRVFLLLLLACCLLIAPAAAAGGSGTAADPYIIQTATELQSIQNNLAAYYKLGNDINLQGVSFTPIGSTSSPFIGSFDGAGYTISNLVISSSTDSTGFFRCLGSGATIKDMTFADCSVTSTSTRCGVVIGSIFMSSTTHETAVISDVDCVRCSASASGARVGCLAGQIYISAVVEITDCDISASNAESTSAYVVSNLVGSCDSGSSIQILRCTVANSHAKASTYVVSNLVGSCDGGSSVSAENCDVINCIAESTSSYMVSNFVGSTGGSSVSAENCDVINCIAKATSYVGGLFGYIDKNNNAGSNVAVTNCNIIDCTIVATSNYAGGIAGKITPSSTGIFSGCTVSGCTILANTYAAGICPEYS